MCTRSNATVSPISSKEATSSESTPLIHRQQLATLLKTNPETVLVIHVNEKDENCKMIEGSVNIPLGSLCFKSALHNIPEAIGKQIITVCPFGYRAGIAAREMRRWGFNASALDGGMNAWENPIVCNFPFVVVLGSDELEKATMALTIAFASQKNGTTSCVILMGPGVMLAKKSGKGGLEGKEHLGDPFKPVLNLIDGFLSEGGLIFCCTSCLKLRKIGFEDCCDYLHPATAPDVARWLRESSGSLSYT